MTRLESLFSISAFALFALFGSLNARSTIDDVLQRQMLKSNLVDPTEYFANQKSNSRTPLDDYYRQRQLLIDEELDATFGSEIILSDKEKFANEIIMKAKDAEYRGGTEHPEQFIPSRHIFERLEEIKESKLFQIIRKMPKGGILHAHDTSLCSADYLVSLTYMDDLWQLTETNSSEIKQFLFSRKQPKSNNVNEIWRLVSDARSEMHQTKYDAYVRTLFTLFDKKVNPRIQFTDINDVWNRFMGLFMKIGGIVTYAPVFKSYYKHAMKEMLEDGVQYLEFRGLLPELYDLDGKTYGPEEVMEIYVEAAAEFKIDYPAWIGSKFIYAPVKQASNETIATYFDTVQQLNAKFPEFLAGFDLVGQEDTASPIVQFADHILKLPDDIHFFFHAGETNWFGSVDENLVDAILLGSQRIGHGYALAKHPKLMELVKSKNIALEINPVSNQVLKLVDDYRNHPASILLANNVSVVISSDDPSFWEVTPLSHDFYMAFVGLASRESDLRILKKFAINSIVYSSLSETEKNEAFTKWQNKWNSFIDDLVREDEV